MSEPHYHHHSHFKEENLIIVMVLNFVITLVEVVEWLLSGSLPVVRRPA